MPTAGDARDRAVQLAAREGLFTVLRRSSAPETWGHEYVAAAYHLAALLREATHGPNQRQARQQWNRACGLTRGPSPSARQRALGGWVRLIVDAEDPGAELQAAIEAERLSEEQKGRLTALLDELRNRPRGGKRPPKDLPTLKDPIPASISKRSLFVVIHYLLHVTREPGFAAVNKSDPGEQIRKLYERGPRSKRRPKRRIPADA